MEGRFRDVRFCCARLNDGASNRSLSPLCEGGQGGGGLHNQTRHDFLLSAADRDCSSAPPARASRHGWLSGLFLAAESSAGFASLPGSSAGFVSSARSPAGFAESALATLD